MKTCWIMCGGPSAVKKLNVECDVIAVNKDIVRYRNEAKYFITCDNRFTVWCGDSLKDTKATKILVVGMNNKYMRCTNHFSDMRFGTSYDLSFFDAVLKSYHSAGIGIRFNDFRSGANSGYSALQLALLLGYKEINLVGVDLCCLGEKTHHHDGYFKCKDNYPDRLDSFFETWKDGLLESSQKFPEVKIYSCSKISRLNSIIPYKEVY